MIIVCLVSLVALAWAPGIAFGQPKSQLLSMKAWLNSCKANNVPQFIIFPFYWQGDNTVFEITHFSIFSHHQAIDNHDHDYYCQFERNLDSPGRGPLSRPVSASLHCINWDRKLFQLRVAPFCG